MFFVHSLAQVRGREHLAPRRLWRGGGAAAARPCALECAVQLPPLHPPSTPSPPCRPQLVGQGLAVDAEVAGAVLGAVCEAQSWDKAVALLKVLQVRVRVKEALHERAQWGVPRALREFDQRVERCV